MCTMPSAGLARNYTCSYVDDDGKYLFAGTSGGELCLFNI